MSYYPICRLSELPQGERKAVEIQGLSLLVFNIDGEFYAIENRCSHEDLPLTEGHVENAHIMCPFHGAKFCLKTGAALSAPAFEDIQMFPVIQQGENLFVSLAPLSE